MSSEKAPCSPVAGSVWTRHRSARRLASFQRRVCCEAYSPRWFRRSVPDRSQAQRIPSLAPASRSIPKLIGSSSGNLAGVSVQRSYKNATVGAADVVRFPAFIESLRANRLNQVGVAIPSHKRTATITTDRLAGGPKHWSDDVSATWISRGSALTPGTVTH